MEEHQLRQLRTLVKSNPSLLWYTRAYDQLNEEAIAEAIYNYGSWETVAEYHHILGLPAAKDVFERLRKKRRTNLLPKTQHFFALYYGKHTH